MPKRSSVKRLRKGERCKEGFERVTIKVGKRTIQACIRMDEMEERIKKIKDDPWWRKVLDVAAMFSP